MNAPIDRLLATAPFLGVATVCELDPEIRVALPSGEAVTANLALGQHYDAAIGDQLLVIGNEDGHWIIGIVHGKGRFILQHAGDIEIRAGGKLSLVAKKGMSLAAPSLETVVDTFELVAEKSKQRFGNLYQRVRKLLSVSAGEAHSHVAGTSLQQAKKHAVVAEETASVNGKQILLG